MASLPIKTGGSFGGISCNMQLSLPWTVPWISSGQGKEMPVVISSVHHEFDEGLIECGRLLLSSVSFHPIPNPPFHLKWGVASLPIKTGGSFGGISCNMQLSLPWTVPWVSSGQGKEMPVVIYIYISVSVVIKRA